MIDDPNDELSKELKKESLNKRRISELAISKLGRTSHAEGVPASEDVSERLEERGSEFSNVVGKIAREPMNMKET